MATYFVAYYFHDDKSNGHGQTIFRNSGEIMGEILLENFRKSIQKKGNLKSIVLTNVIRLEQPPTETV